MPNEASILTQIAFESKSYWKYDKGYLEAAREHIKVTERDIENNHVYLYQEGRDILGFYHFINKQEESELVWFFVHPSSIGNGIGKLLWNHLIELISELEINEFIIKSDPNAEPFYIK